MSNYKVIRASEGYGMVIAVTPPDATPENYRKKEAKFFLHNDLLDGETDFFSEVSVTTVIGYFSGHADGMGFGQLPENSFTDLAEIQTWATEKAAEYRIECGREMLLTSSVIYRSGIDYSNVPEWIEEGTVPPCVDPFKIGTYRCSCGQHEVEAEMTADPHDNKDRIARTVRTIQK